MDGKCKCSLVVQKGTQVVTFHCIHKHAHQSRSPHEAENGVRWILSPTFPRQYIIEVPDYEAKEDSQELSKKE